VADNGDVQRVRVIDDADLGFFGCGRGLDWLTLQQRPDRRSCAPGRLIQSTVDPDRFRDTNGGRAWRRRLWVGRLREQREKD